MVFRHLKQTNSKIENRPFEIIMRYNIKEAQHMYKESEPCELLRLLLLRFKEKSRQKGHHPIILVMPQLIDLKIGCGRKFPYEEFFQEMNHEIRVIDLTSLIKNENTDNWYAEDVYGGHFSAKGNREIAKILAKIPEINSFF